MSRFPAIPSTNSGADEVRNRLTALSNVLTKTDRILTGNRDITMRFYEQSPAENRPVAPAPAWTDGTNINIDKDKLNDIGSLKTLIQILGMNYHELCHILFTPGKEAKFIKDLAAMGYYRSFNVLEDQRIETMFVAMYEPAAKYFTEMMVQMFLQDEGKWKFAHFLTYGRRYLPRELRDQMLEQFEIQCKHPGKDDLRHSLENVIDEYRLLNLKKPFGQQRCTDLTTRYHKLIRELASYDQDDPPQGNECPEQGSGSNNMTAGQTEQVSKQAAEKTEEQDDEEKSDPDADGSGFYSDADDDGSEDEDEPGDSDGEEEGESGDSDDSEHDEGSGSDADEDDESEADEDGGNGASESGSADDDDSDGHADSDDGEGGGSMPSDGSESGDSESSDAGDDDSDSKVGGNSSATTDAEIRDTLRNIVSAVHESESAQQEIKQVRDAMFDPANMDISAERVAGTLADATPEMQQTAAEIEKLFSDLSAQFDPGWRYGSDTGKLNVGRAMFSDDYEDIFDEWEEGHEDSAGLELVILFDMSSSMNEGVAYVYGGEVVRKCEVASEALWTIQKGVSALDSNTTVLGFHEYKVNLFGRHDSVEPGVYTIYNKGLLGNTCPATAMQEAARIMRASERTNKLFVIITDGAFSKMGANYRNLIPDIPATRLFIGIGRAQNSYEEYYDNTVITNDASLIVPTIKDAIATMIRNKLIGN